MQYQQKRVQCNYRQYEQCKRLDLSTKFHPKPYKTSWIKKGIETKMTMICKVSFSIGNHYQDVVTCDVVDMDAYHMLLDHGN